MYIAVSSDGGLCGGIHSSVTRQLKRDLAKDDGHIAVIGDKPKAQISRSLADHINVSFNSVGKDVPTFSEASAIADGIIKNGGDWDEVGLICLKQEARRLTQRLTGIRSESFRITTYQLSHTRLRPSKLSLLRRSKKLVRYLAPPFVKLFVANDS